MATDELNSNIEKELKKVNNVKQNEEKKTGEDKNMEDDGWESCSDAEEEDVSDDEDVEMK